MTFYCFCCILSVTNRQKGCKTMKKQPYGNLEQRLEEIQQAMKTENEIRLYQRYQVIHLHLQGHKNREIAQMVNLSEITVGTYLKKYREQGIEGLKMRHSPAEAGLKTIMNWMSPLVRKFRVQYANRSVLNLLHRLGFSHTRPTYTLAKADPVIGGLPY